MIEIKNLCIERGENLVIDNFHLNLEVDEITALVGPSGCGKSTFLLGLLGATKVKAGEIIVNGENLITSPIEKRNFGVVFQDLALFEGLSVFKNIAYGLYHLTKGEKEKRVVELLNLFKIAKLRNKLPRQLSGGEKQRVALARALAPNPTYLLLDETFSSLDPLIRNEVRVEVRNNLKKLGRGCLLVSHDMNEVFSFADKIIVLDQNGNIQQAGTVLEVKNNPTSEFVKNFCQS